MKDIYNELIKVMNTSEIDSHESDLYIKVNNKSKKLIDQYEFKQNVTTFKSNIDSSIWYDIPFAYKPFWNNK